MKKIFYSFSLCASLFLYHSTALCSGAIQSFEYKFEASVDPLILPDRKTELWAAVYLPKMINKPIPLIIFLHGNHATCGTGENPRIDRNCQYTKMGTCPKDHIVVPNHLGYGYLAEQLASNGYMIVSINANRGINCGSGYRGDGGLNLARGKLILRHLQLLAQWNRQGNGRAKIPVNLKGKIDFQNMGIMGHSRGGEGARAAYHYSQTEEWKKIIGTPINIKSILEIAPVDRQTSLLLTPHKVTWNTVLPMCDGDVSNLAGIRPFDRMINELKAPLKTAKSVYTIWGANHNFFNTEWQTSDSSGCRGHEPLWKKPNGKKLQMTTGLYAVYHFFKSTVGPSADPKYGELFNPLVALPKELAKITKIERSFFAGANSSETLNFEIFDQVNGTNSYGFKNESKGIVINHQRYAPPHGSNRKAAIIKWNTPDSYWRGNWAKEGEGKNIQAFATLDIDLSRKNAPEILNPSDFSIQLIDADENISNKLQLRQFHELVGPVGNRSLQYVLGTARIPLRLFSGVDLKNIRSVLLQFDQSPNGEIYITNIRFTRIQYPYQRKLLTYPQYLQNTARLFPRVRASKAAPAKSCKIIESKILNARNGKFRQVSFYTPQGFEPRGEMLRLKVGKQYLSYFTRPTNGDIRTVTFYIPRDYPGALSSQFYLTYGKQEWIHCHP
jgi:hypothetical protein